MNVSDTVARSFTKIFRAFADVFFKKRYGHRAVVLETVAAVPGMVAGMWVHLRSLRTFDNRYNLMIKDLLDESANERMHLMIFINISKPTAVERFLILAAQFIFWHFYFAMYMFFPKTAHLMIAYFEEEAVRSYTSYLNMIESGELENVAAPSIAIDYYNLASNARLSDVIKCVRNDEQNHSNVNYKFSKI